MKTVVRLVATGFSGVAFVAAIAPAKADDDRYDKVICAKLEPIMKALERLQRQKKVGRYSEGEFAKGKWNTDLDALWALKDKLRGRTVGFSKDEPSYLGYYFTASEQPSHTGMNNPYVAVSKTISTTMKGSKASASYEMALAQRIMRSRGNLQADQVFTMAVESTGGDLPLAMIVAHNLLKEAAYASRSGAVMSIGQADVELGKTAANQYRKLFGTKTLAVSASGGKTEFMLHPSHILDKLSNLRPNFDPHREDKIGPWYHNFGLLFYGSTATSGRYGAEFLAHVENVTRLIGIGSGRSLGKEALNRCASKLVGRMNDAEKEYDKKLVADKNKRAGIKFQNALITIRNTVEAYKWGKKIGSHARRGVGSAEEIRALVREIYGRYPQGSKLREAFRRGYVAGSQ